MAGGAEAGDCGGVVAPDCVARHYDVNANQVFIWRKRYRDELGAGAALPAPQLIPVPF